MMPFTVLLEHMAQNFSVDTQLGATPCPSFPSVLRDQILLSKGAFYLKACSGGVMWRSAEYFRQ